MAVEAPEKPNLRALYKELDKEIAFQFGYILDVTQAKEEKFSLKKLLRMQPKKSYQDKLEDLSAIDDISLAAFLPARSSDITKEHQLSPSQITDIAYERLSHNVRKVFKVSQFDIDIILTERNTENLQSVADNPEELVETLERTVPPYLVDWRAIEVERPKGKQEVKDLAQALKVYQDNLVEAAKIATEKPYKLAEAVKAQQALLYFDHYGPKFPPVRPLGTAQRKQEEAKLDGYKKLYYEQLISQNASAKKFPKNSLTHFENLGLAVLEKHEAYMNKKNAIGAEVKMEESYIEAKEFFDAGHEEHIETVREYKEALALCEDPDDKALGMAELNEIEQERANEKASVEKLFNDLKAAKEKDLKKVELSDADKRLCEAFLEHATDNKKFNKRLGRAMKKGHLYKIEKDSKTPSPKQKFVDTLHKYTYKTLGIKNIMAAGKKLKGVLGKIKENFQHKFAEKEKVSLKELGQISKFVENKEMFGLMEELNPKSEKLNKILIQRRGLSKLQEGFKEKVAKKDPLFMRSGDIIVDVSKYEQQFKGRNAKGWKAKIQDWITPYSHAGISMNTAKGTNRSHVYGNYEYREQKYQESIVSKSFRIYPDRLIHKEEDKKALVEAFNVDLDELPHLLQHEYQKVAHEINEEIASKAAPESFANSEKRREMAGKASFVPGGHKSKESVSSWAEKTKSAPSLAEGMNRETGN